MKVVVGTNNTDKVKIVKKAFAEIHMPVQVESVNIDSDFSLQPLDRETTKKGAVNIASGAHTYNPVADFGVGMKGGLCVNGDGYCLTSYACLHDSQGNTYIGESDEIELPNAVSNEIKKGKQYGEVIKRFAKKPQINESIIAHNLSFTQALHHAYVDYLKKNNHLGYRKKASAVILDKDNNFLLVQLVNYKDNQWNYSGGGTEAGESAKETIVRELKEELGTDKFEIIKMSKTTQRYDWPDFIIAQDLKNKKIKYRGQKVSFFLTNFLGDRKDIDPDPGEIRNVKWVRYDELKDHFIFERQLEITEKLISEFRPELIKTQS